MYRLRAVGGDCVLFTEWSPGCTFMLTCGRKHAERGFPGKIGTTSSRPQPDSSSPSPMATNPFYRAAKGLKQFKLNGGRADSVNIVLYGPILTLRPDLRR